MKLTLIKSVVLWIKKKAHEEDFIPPREPYLVISNTMFTNEFTINKNL